jgi:hypothetical protein
LLPSLLSPLLSELRLPLLSLPLPPLLVLLRLLLSPPLLLLLLSSLESIMPLPK